MNIVQYHHSCEVSSSKIRQFFAEFHVSQFLRNYNVYKDVRLCSHDRKARPRQCFRGGSSTNGSWNGLFPSNAIAVETAILSLHLYDERNRAVGLGFEPLLDLRGIGRGKWGRDSEFCKKLL